MDDPDQYNYEDSQAERPYNDVIIRRVNEIIVSRASVELYRALLGARHWEPIGSGILYLMQNQSIYYLILFTTENLRAIWQKEINRNCEYKVDKPYFHIVFTRDELLGINFADLTEAEMFCTAVERLWPFRKMFISRKKVPPKVDAIPTARSIDAERKYPSNDTERFYRDEIPTKIARPRSKPSTPAPLRNHHAELTEYDSDYFSNHSSGRVPVPPPLPPPVQNFHFATTTGSRYMTPRSYSGSQSGHNSHRSNNSFGAQIKHEAHRRHAGLQQNFFKYLP